MRKFMKLYEKVINQTNMSKEQFPFVLYVNDKKYNSYKTEKKCNEVIAKLKKINKDADYDIRPI